MKLCDTCIYRNNVEQSKPCIIYRDNCEYYEKERGDMTREEAILCLKGIKNYGRDTFTEQSDWQNSLDMAIEALEQEPKTGHWIDDMRLGYNVSICSNCNWRGHGDTCLIYKPKYCPNCGAKMESEDDNT